jgi:hypothetical protein
MTNVGCGCRVAFSSLLSLLAKQYHQQAFIGRPAEQALHVIKKLEHVGPNLSLPRNTKFSCMYAIIVCNFFASKKYIYTGIIAMTGVNLN